MKCLRLFLWTCGDLWAGADKPVELDLLAQKTLSSHALRPVFHTVFYRFLFICTLSPHYRLSSILSCSCKSTWKATGVILVFWDHVWWREKWRLSSSDVLCSSLRGWLQRSEICQRQLMLYLRKIAVRRPGITPG